MNLSSVIPFSSCLQSFPASVFPNESALHIRWSKYCGREIPNHRSVLVIQNPSSFLRKWVNFLCLHGHRILIYFKKMYIYIYIYILMWTIFKVFIEFVTVLSLFHVLFFWLWGMWDLNSPARNWTQTSCIGSQSLSLCWNTSKVLLTYYFKSGMKMAYYGDFWGWCGEGNGNPLQNSSLENPMDGGAW